MNIGKCVRRQSILHPIYTISRTTLDNMVLFLLSLVVTVVVVVIARIRHRIAFTGFSRLGIPRGDFSITRARSERSPTPSPVKQFLVVVLPDGTIVIPKVEGCSGPVTL